MKRWARISEQTLALADNRADVLAELSRELSPGGWVVLPLAWRPRRIGGAPDGVDVQVDVPSSPAGLLA